MIYVWQYFPFFLLSSVFLSGSLSPLIYCPLSVFGPWKASCMQILLVDFYPHCVVYPCPLFLYFCSWTISCASSLPCFLPLLSLFCTLLLSSLYLETVVLLVLSCLGWCFLFSLASFVSPLISSSLPLLSLPVSSGYWSLLRFSVWLIVSSIQDYRTC